MKPYNASSVTRFFFFFFGGVGWKPHFQRVATISLPVDHVKYFLLYRVPCSVSGGPAIGSTTALGPNEEVLGIVNVLVGAILNALNNLDITLSLGYSPDSHSRRTRGSRSNSIARGM